MSADVSFWTHSQEALVAGKEGGREGRAPGKVYYAACGRVGHLGLRPAGEGREKMQQGSWCAYLPAHIHHWRRSCF